MKITPSQLRQIIRQEVLAEAAKKKPVAKKKSNTALRIAQDAIALVNAAAIATVQFDNELEQMLEDDLRGGYATPEDLRGLSAAKLQRLPWDKILPKIKGTLITSILDAAAKVSHDPDGDKFNDEFEGKVSLAGGDDDGDPDYWRNRRR